MSISDADFAIWLSAADRQPVALTEVDYKVEVAGAAVTSTLYFANRAGFVSGAADTPASQPYTACVTKIAKYTRALDRAKLGGKYTIGFGAYEFVNVNGDLDAMLGYALDGSAVRQYYGDLRWPKADHRLIFTAQGGLATAPDTKQITFSIRDAIASLKRNIGGTEFVGGTAGNDDRPRPFNLGYCRNIEFLLVDELTNTYCYGTAAESVSGKQQPLFVRDRAFPLNGPALPTLWSDNLDGTVTLASTPDGQITGDVVRVQDAADINTTKVSHFYRMLAGEEGGLVAKSLYYGPHSSFVVDDDQDFNLAYSVRESENLDDILTKVANSSNTFYATRRDNSFSFGRIFPFNAPGASVMDFTDDDIRPPNALKSEPLIPMYDQVLCTGNQNGVQQSDYYALITPTEREIYSRKGQYYAESAPSGTTYALNPALYHQTMSKSPVLETLITTGNDVQGEFQLGLFAEVKRKAFLSWVRLFDFTAGLRAYTLELGDVATVTTARFGLNSGPAMQVAMVAIDLNGVPSVDLTLAYRQEGSGLDSRESYLLQLNGDYLLQLNGDKIRIA